MKQAGKALFIAGFALACCGFLWPLMEVSEPAMIDRRTGGYMVIVGAFLAVIGIRLGRGK